ncbi:hypothetical protein TWF569_007630 [Orbilia oligospora]|uniref:Uncharacterized protein n=1 Tax=Orbilia oligospora TaxID=2813651 RepID=A0A7C8JVD9_ORBOL|nr:hypothetical protein TWF103_000904 [Orbilia oligospora]KAF3093940.1 hypothetical protein TWF102_007765 [Orbilia oligospora]KAF3134154.1 hypothetical protein TWF703_006487 [Orbilia oligospora]KAF3142320.1 hypothetical protein TWF569_007630 [Orbilia oligospora]KAF3145840.1 hypothetical protein TWF594_003826 [Orbilia oligospora]
MPLLEPSEVVALGLSPKDIPAHKPQTPRKGAGHVGYSTARVTMAQTSTRRKALNHRNLISTSSRSSGRSTSNSFSSNSNSASPTLSTSRLAFGAGARTGSSFEVCIPIPSKREQAVLQQYERFPDADIATDVEIIRVGVEDAQEWTQDDPIGETQPDVPGHSSGPNGLSGTDIDLDMSEKRSTLEPEVPEVPTVRDVSL